MSEATKAVFLSYAREDAAAARRIAEALRAAGLEVWFDEAELRGGDTWDAKIRGQIGACALFLPIISTQTQARAEGYFRREWKLADHRTEDMGRRRAFLVPVCIDDTKDADADVPDSFLRVQWTRLPGALPTPQFVEQVKRLLEAPQKTVGRDLRIPPSSEKAGFGDPALQKKGLPGWTWGVLTAVVVGIGAYLALRPAPVGPVSDRPHAEPKPAMVTVPVAPLKADKSVAVLPFTNMSEDKDASGFFADGVHEDILTNLALIRELRVVSRTSVMQYRGTTKPMKQLAQELGVTYILEGSVRRSGNKVRVTGQLIHAATDEHVWAATYDRDLTDVFAIQTELSQQIAAALKMALSPEEKARLDRKGTDNATAYDLFVKARELSFRMWANFSPTSGISSNGQREQEIEALLQAAVKLDPKFVDAWLSLVYLQGRFYDGNVDRTPARRAKAKEAIDRAVALAPDSPAVISGLSNYYRLFENNHERAAGELEKLARLQPNSPEVFFSLGVVRRSQGRWAEALAHLRKATQLDPAYMNAATVLALSLRQCRRFDEELAERRRIVARWPDQKGEIWALAILEDLLSGTTRAMDAVVARYQANEADRPRAIYLLKQRAALLGDCAEFVRLDRLQPYFDEDGGVRNLQAIVAALAYLAGGDEVAARARLENFPAELRLRLVNEPDNPRIWQNVGMMEAILGNKEEAVRCARKAVDLMADAPDADRLPLRLYGLAAVYAWTGDKDRAVAELGKLLQIPSTYSGRSLKTDLMLFPLRGDPRFEVIVNDPKNDQPLF